MNLLTKLIEHKNRRPHAPAVQYIKKKNLYTLSWSQCYDRVDQYRAVLLSLGVQKGDRICLYSNTNKEWGFLDLAVMACGAVTVPIYHSSHPDEVRFIIEDSSPRFVFVENESLYGRLIQTEYPRNQIVAINDFESHDSQLLFLKNQINCTPPPDSLEDRAQAIKSQDLATIIYTSGTSGTPKGVCLSHRQIESSVTQVFPILGVTHLDRTLTFLPFSHVLGRIELWGHYYCGYTIGYAQSVERLKSNLPMIQPTILVGVPRIFEKIYFGTKAQIEISKLKQSIFHRALKIGSDNIALRQKKKSPSFLQALKSRLAYQWVFANIHEKMGGQLRFAISGGAPLDSGISQFFAACGLPILEGYGLTETTGPVFVNTLYDHKEGSVGKAIGDVQVLFGEDQEILIKSEKVMTGYFNDAQSPDSTFTEEGYLRTGDIGELDDQGFLKITDRKKDLIKTAGGKFVAPQKLQKLFSQNPLVGHVHIHGDKRKYIVALITLEKDRVMELKKKFHLAASDFSQLTQSQKIQEEVRQSLAQANNGLASFETIKRYKVLDHEFSIEAGQLTPSLKMKRKKIDQMYRQEIDSLYS